MDRLPEIPEVVRPVGRSGRRQRAAALQERMLAHRPIYNAAALVRDSWRGSERRRAECIARLAEAVIAELARTEDREACLYAVADALCCSPLGTPWEA